VLKTNKANGIGGGGGWRKGERRSGISFANEQAISEPKWGSGDIGGRGRVVNVRHADTLKRQQ